MSDPNKTFNADSTAYVDVVVGNDCSRVYIEENYDSATPPTQDLIVQRPKGGTDVKVPKGTGYTFTPVGGARFFSAGVTIGAIKPSAGSVTLRQIEGRAI